MHRTRASQQIYCKSPPHPGNPLVCAPTHTRVHMYTPPTLFTGGMHPALCDASLQMGHAQGHAAKETSESSGVPGGTSQIRASYTGACLDGLRWKWGLRLGPASPQRAELEAFSGDVPARMRQAAVKKEGGGRRTRRGRARAARGETVGSAGVTAVTRKRHLA